MSRGMSPAQRRAYDGLRALTARMLDNYPQFAQKALAAALGVNQSWISSVLKGKQISTVVLEGVVRLMLGVESVSVEDRRLLHDELKRALAVIRTKQPTPPPKAGPWGNG